jgi:translation initiation factor IF-1
LPKEEMMRYTGRVLECLPNAVFKVKLDELEHIVTAYIGGKMRKNDIKIITGDSVVMEMSPYDLNRARIVYRTK